MSLRYILVMHLQATCFEDQPRDPYHRKSEIIDFPVVLLNLETGNIIEQFREYVRPIENPILSATCLQLTRITQSTVDRAFPLEDVLKLFDLWITAVYQRRHLRLPTSYSDRNYNCVIATWTGHDLNCFLRLEAERKHISLKPYLYRWIDLKHVFKTKHNLTSFGFQEAVAKLAEECEGFNPPFNAQGLAKVAYQMHKGGCTLELTSAMF